MFLRPRFFFLSTILASALIASNVSAAIVVTFQPQLTIAPGESGKLDVFIRSNAPQSDLLGIYSAKFQITPIDGDGLVFLNPPTDTQYSEPNYIFAGSNDGLSSIVRAPDTIIVGDGTRAPNGFVEVPTEDQLLTTLDLDASLATAGARFQISMVNDADTDFLDDGLTSSLPVAAESFSNIGTVAVTAIPEPASLVFLSFAGALGLLRRRSRVSRTAAKHNGFA